jgi:hypothetical protein
VKLDKEGRPVVPRPTEGPLPCQCDVCGCDTTTDGEDACIDCRRKLASQVVVYRSLDFSNLVDVCEIIDVLSV